jgi:hypothetical protein
MPIDHSGNGYLATDAGILVDAFEGALKALRLADRNDPAALVVANHIITFAKTACSIPCDCATLLWKLFGSQRLSLTALRAATPGRHCGSLISFAERDFSPPNRITLTESCRCNNS